MRASGASELRKFNIFTFYNCYFLQYFVGTSDTLSQKHIHSICTDNKYNVLILREREASERLRNIYFRTQIYLHTYTINAVSLMAL